MLKFNKEQIKNAAVKTLRFFANPHLLLCVGIAWFITNGWSYVMLAVGTYLQIGWMIGVSSAYLAFLWLPISPEKLVTAAIAIFLLKKLFPNDTKTLAVLRDIHSRIKAVIKARKEKRDAKKKTRM